MAVSVDIYTRIAHPIRREMILYLGEKGPSRYTDITRDLHISVGSFYHHLRILGDLVEKGADGRYVLTPKGYEVYKMILGGEEPIGRLQSLIKPLNPIYDVLSLRPLLKTTVKGLKGEKVLAVALTLTVLLASYEWGTAAVLHSAYRFQQPVSVVLTALSILGLWGLAEAMSRLYKGRKTSLESLIGVVIAHIPILIYGAVLPMLAGMHEAVGKLSYLLAQLMSLLIYVETLSSVRGLRMPHAAAIGLLTAYIGLLILLI